MKQHPYLPDLDTPVDYSLTQNWLCLPKKIAKPDDKPVDIFYLYPTAYYKTPHGPNICEVNNEAMRIRATEHLQTKASVFSAYGNFYAPAYRQAALECLLDNTPENNLLFTKGPVTCVLSAFDYYIKHHNNGRPFILAGHSQGSLLLQFILSLYLKEHPEVQERMIAAYVIGYSITRGYLKDNPHLTFARGAKDTGVIISYNTESPGVTGDNITLLPDAVSINPITWTLTGKKAEASQSLGSRLVIRDSAGTLVGMQDLPHYADAALDLERGTVICSTADPDAFKVIGQEEAFPSGVLHTGDYPLYYYDLQNNVKTRIKSYFASHPQTDKKYAL